MRSVVFLHAFPCDHRMWEPQAEAVASAGWEAVTMDLPGFGGTPLPEDDPSLDPVADAVVSALGPRDSVVLVGVSLGGYVAMNILRRHPGRAGALVLCDTKASSDVPEARLNRERLAMAVESQGSECGRILEQAVLPGLLGASTHDRRPDVVEKVRGWLLEADPGAVAWYQRAMAERPDSREALSAFGGPVAIIWGEEDALSPWSEQELMRAACPGSSLLRIPEAGHLANVEDPVAVTAGLLGFLGSARL